MGYVYNNCISLEVNVSTSIFSHFIKSNNMNTITIILLLMWFAFLTLEYFLC